MRDSATVGLVHLRGTRLRCSRAHAAVAVEGFLATGLAFPVLFFAAADIASAAFASDRTLVDVGDDLPLAARGIRALALGVVLLAVDDSTATVAVDGVALARFTAAQRRAVADAFLRYDGLRDRCLVRSSIAVVSCSVVTFEFGFVRCVRGVDDARHARVLGSRVERSSASVDLVIDFGGAGLLVGGVSRVFGAAGCRGDGGEYGGEPEARFAGHGSVVGQSRG